MELDTVELIVAIEEEFEISIPDDETARLARVGDIFSYVVKAKEMSENEKDATWEKVKKVVIEKLGVEPNQVTKEAHIVYDLDAD